MRKVYITVVIIIVCWYSFWGYLHVRRSSETYTDMLYLAVESELRNIQEVSETADQALEFITKNGVRPALLSPRLIVAKASHHLVWSSGCPPTLLED